MPVRLRCRKNTVTDVDAVLCAGDSGMSLAGAMGGHTVVAKLLTRFGSEEQQRTYFPDLQRNVIAAQLVSRGGI